MKDNIHDYKKTMVSINGKAGLQVLCSGLIF